MSEESKGTEVSRYFSMKWRTIGGKWRIFDIGGGKNMQVKIVKNGTTSALENNLNNFLKELSNKKIVNVSVTVGFDGEEEVLVGTILYED